MNNPIIQLQRVENFTKLSQWSGNMVNKRVVISERSLGSRLREEGGFIGRAARTAGPGARASNPLHNLDHLTNELNQHN